MSKDFEKCETCSQAKITKRPHKSVVRCTELLELIHSNLCDFEGILTCRGNRYIITFIDNLSKYTTIYLLKKTVMLLKNFKIFKKKLKINSVEK